MFDNGQLILCARLDMYYLQLAITQYSWVSDQYNSVNHEDQFLPNPVFLNV